MTLATVYAPNDQQDTFIHSTLSLLMDFTEGHLILGGDFNVPLAPTEDTSSSTSSLRSSVHKSITRDLHNAQLIDIWRLHHSAPHKTYSHIDYFLIPHCQLEAAHNPVIGNITWSDQYTHYYVLLPLTTLDISNTDLEAERKPSTDSYCVDRCY